MRLVPGMAGYSLPLGRFQGIPLTLHWSLLLILAWYLIQWFRAYDATGILLAIVWLGLHLGSILFHELAHAHAARRLGYRTLQIELHAFGGFARISGELTPWESLRVSLAGPASNLLLFVVFQGAAALMKSPWSWIFGGAATWNLVLAGFNLLPVYPLDGGSAFLAAARMRWTTPFSDEVVFRVGTWIAGAGVVLGILTNSVLMALIFITCFQACRAAHQQSLASFGSFRRLGVLTVFVELLRFGLSILRGRVARAATPRPAPAATVERHVRQRLRLIVNRVNQERTAPDGEDDASAGGPARGPVEPRN